MSKVTPPVPPTWEKYRHSPKQYKGTVKPRKNTPKQPKTPKNKPTESQEVPQQKNIPINNCHVST